MKKLYLLGIALLAATFAFAQANTNAISKSLSSAKTIDKVPVNKHNVSLTKDAVLIQDFTSETFPPEGWDTIQGAESVELQHWQRYAQDYDGNDQPCAGVQYANSDGTPRNQDEWLISPEFTVPEDGVLSFDYFSNPGWFVQGWSTSFGGDYADINVKVSTDNGANWINVWNEDDYSNAVGGSSGFPQMRWAPISVDISQYANQTIKIAFQYVGADAAFWYIDNVNVDAAATIDYALTDGLVSMNPQYVNFGYNGMFNNFPRNEINQYSRCSFHGVVNNYGSEAANVNFVTKVYGPDNSEVFSFTHPTRTVAAGTWDNGTFTPGIDTISCYTYDAGEDSYTAIEGAIMKMQDVMTANGTYRFEISLEPASGTYENVNSRPLSYTYYTTISDDCLYARDAAQYDGTGDYFEANDPNWHNFTVFGTPYQLWNPNDQVNAIEAYISEAEEGALIHFELYGESSEGGYVDGVLITEQYEVGADFTPGFLKLYAEDVWDLSNDIDAEGSYIPVLACVVVENDKRVSVAIDESVEGTDYINKAKNADNWYNITGVNGALMIRLYNCEQTPDQGGAVNTFEASEIAMFPNPTTGIVNFSNVENATIEVFNMMGQVVSRVENANENTTIDLSTVANGNYVVRIVMNGEVATSKLNIAR
ncbi:MAG: choice-of-anchor J domain-containing protein [Bacteroidales bacterium]|nr:choice-of-anchor J domain-containing protein [Bacteroidales bacterium]